MLCRRFIDTLEKEKAEFQKDMLVVENLTNQRREQSDRQSIAELTEICDESDRQIIEETHKVQMLDKKVIQLDSNQYCSVKIYRQTVVVATFQRPLIIFIFYKNFVSQNWP